MTPLSDLLAKIKDPAKTKTKKKFRRTGRHHAPFQIRKTSLRAGAIVVATAAAGGIAAIPLTSNLASAAPSASIRQAGQPARSAASRSATPVHSTSTARHHGATTSHHSRAAHSPSRRPGQHAALRGPAKPAVAVLKCAGTGAMLPQNYPVIVRFLTTHGYTRLAAAGIAGNMYQESMGNPESVGTGGGGLIGFTPLPAGYVTGNPAADMHTQLDAVLAYNKQWAQYIPALNAATTATQAADIYMNYFERPGIPAAYNRETAANAVASACGF